MIGETISHYRITAKLGVGGMGIVHKAQDLQLERIVALKFLSPDLALSDNDRERFLREARSASVLDHPNIGVICGIDKTPDGQLFIVMAYSEGRTPGQEIGASLPAPRQALAWICQIAAGLSAAHARNIVHRDIKPSNIIINSDGTARIVDFGLARVVASPSATMTGGATGTLPYMPPEQILGEPVDQRCDVWALSVLLVQLVTGSHSFARESTTAMTFAILNQSPAAMDQSRPNLNLGFGTTPRQLHPLLRMCHGSYPAWNGTWTHFCLCVRMPRHKAVASRSRQQGDHHPVHYLSMVCRRPGRTGTPSSVCILLAVLELWILEKSLREEFFGIRFGNSVRIPSVVIHIGKLKQRILQREVAPYSAVCVPVCPVQHAPF